MSNLTQTSKQYYQEIDQEESCQLGSSDEIVKVTYTVGWGLPLGIV